MLGGWSNMLYSATYFQRTASQERHRAARFYAIFSKPVGVFWQVLRSERVHFMLPFLVKI